MAGPNRINDGFGWRIDPISGKRTWHNGVDYTLPTGVPISTNMPMTVVGSGVQNGYGNIVTLRDANGNTYKYAHLDKLNVREGEQIPADTVIGWTGNTGKSTGPHLHTEAADPSGKSVDPNSIDPLTGRLYTDVVGFKKGQTLNQSIKDAVPDSNRATRPQVAPEKSKTPAEIALERERERKRTGPGSNLRPRPTNDNVGILINPRHILGDGG